MFFFFCFKLRRVYFEIHFITLCYCYDQYLIDTAWTRVDDNDDMIGCAKVVSVSTSYSRCYILVLSSCLYDSFTSCITDSFLVA